MGIGKIREALAAENGRSDKLRTLPRAIPSEEGRKRSSLFGY